MAAKLFCGFLSPSVQSETYRDDLRRKSSLRPRSHSMLRSAFFPLLQVDELGLACANTLHHPP